MNENVLVVAFDGLDKDLIDKYGLEEIKQQEYGTLDNKTDVEHVKTSELFTSFITGLKTEEHGLEGLGTYHDGWKGDLMEFLNIGYLKRNMPGYYRFRTALKGILDLGEKRRYDRRDLDSETLFEKIDNSRAMFVPGYNPDLMWQGGGMTIAGGLGYSKEKVKDFWDERSYEVRKEKFLHELENDIISPRDFLMVHFHRPDIYHHMYGDVSAENLDFDEEVLRRMYKETDEFASEIIEKAKEAGYDYIIFMSDHGLPTVKTHNENAFYSSNKELFGEKTPKITDFHDKILELTGNEDKIKD